MAQEDRIVAFKEHMKEEFGKIPRNLTVEELSDRSDRCLSLSENFRQEGDGFKTKKYQLLSQKYKQLAMEKQHPELVKKTQPGVPAQAIIEEIPSEPQPVKKSMWKKFLGIFSGKEVKVEIKEEKKS